MQLGGNSDTKTLALRLDNQTQRVVIEQSDNDDLVAVGWEMDSEEALFHRMATPAIHGCTTTRATKASIANTSFTQPISAQTPR